MPSPPPPPPPPAVMGGGIVDSTEDGSSDFSDLYFSSFSDGVLASNIENTSSNGNVDAGFGNTVDTGSGTSNSFHFEADQRRAHNIYAQLLASYSELPRRSAGLQEAKNSILSYRPGSWIGKDGGLKLDDYFLPETTTILLVGPKGSGKSSLINRISKVFDNDKFASERAQVSCHSSVKEGTYFLHEYMVPRASNAFCLFDTRGMSNDLPENKKVLSHWMRKGVRHGEPVKRASDDSKIKSRMKYKNRQLGSSNGKVRMVNFVVMVVNGLSVLESMISDDPEKKQYTKTIATAFKNPLLSFKDDKPAVVVTHGDLLSMSDRVQVRIHLGKLLGIPPKTQIFDIPESNNITTELAIIDLLHHCLEHADSNLPLKRHLTMEMDASAVSALLWTMVVLVAGIIFTYMKDEHLHHIHECSSPPEARVNWREIRHLWLG